MGAPVQSSMVVWAPVPLQSSRSTTVTLMVAVVAGGDGPLSVRAAGCGDGARDGGVAPAVDAAMAPRPSGGCVQGELLTPLSATNTKKCYDFLLRKATKCVKVLVVNIELIWSKSCGSQSAMRGCSVMRRITYLDREMP